MSATVRPVLTSMAAAIESRYSVKLAPNILYLAPESFGAKISQSVTGLEMAAMYVGVMGLPALFGCLTKILPVSVYPIYLAVVFVLLHISTILLKRKLTVAV